MTFMSSTILYFLADRLLAGWRILFCFLFIRTFETTMKRLKKSSSQYFTVEQYESDDENDDATIGEVLQMKRKLRKKVWLFDRK